VHDIICRHNRCLLWFVQYYGPDLHTTATNNNQQYSNSYLE
jgi:hypothetical protein